MVLFNSLYYKKNYLSKKRAIIILGIMKVPENKDFLKQPTEEALKVVKILDKLIEPKEDPIKIKKEISKPI